MKEKPKHKLVIAISGPPGSGKTTYAKIIAKRFKLRYVSAGSLFRETAKKLGLSLEEFHKLAEKDKKYDLMVDKRSIEEAKKGSVVIEGHLTSWILKDIADIKIYVTAPLKERAKRVASRDKITIEQALKEIKEREESNRRRYLQLYGIDIKDLSIFDLIINTAKLSIEDVINVICAYIEGYLRKVCREKEKLKS